MYLKRVEIKNFYFGRTTLVWECYASWIGGFAGLGRGTLILYLSLRPVRHVHHQTSQLSGTYLSDDFSCDSWRWTCLTERRDSAEKTLYDSHSHKIRFTILHTTKASSLRKAKAALSFNVQSRGWPFHSPFSSNRIFWNFRKIPRGRIWIS